MNEPLGSGDTATEIAAARLELLGLLAEAEKARAVLVQWQQYVLNGMNPSEPGHIADLLEANEQLVVSAVEAKNDSDIALRAMAEMARVAKLDPLTQLPNRLLFQDRFTQAIGNARRHNRQMALLFIDLNQFKQINDSLGHTIGDEVLKWAAHCMVSAVRSSDTVCRHGGDEFLILLDEVSQPADAALIADKIGTALAVPRRLGDRMLRLTASIGISLFPDDGDDVGVLIERADAAMYRAKGLGPGRFVFQQPPETETAPQAAGELPSYDGSVSLYEQAINDHETLNAQLQEANEKLLITALDAQALQAAAEQALKRHVEQMARAVHELRSPLMSIRTASAVIGRTDSTDPLLPRMNAVIERQVAQMSRLICDLLDVSRTHGSKLRLELQTTSLRELVEDVVTASRAPIDARRQTLTVEWGDGDLNLQADPVRLAQVLRNLLDNASKYTPFDGTIRLRVERVDDSVVLALRDDGIGIGSRSLPHIFDPFVQDRDATSFNGHGLGLGLTVVRELVQSHHGSVTAHSAGAGLGSEFVVRLPVKPPSPA